MLLVTAIAVFGLFIGSFLNVIIYRLHTKEKIIKSRSHCAKCGKTLHWYELIPVFSFIIQKGKCRMCGKRISLQYLLVEISTAFMFLLIFNFQFSIFNQPLIFNFQFLLSLFFFWIVVSGLIVIFVYDLKHYIIPDKVLVPLIIVVLFYTLVQDFVFNNETIQQFSNLASVQGLISALAISSFFFLLFYVSNGRWMGFGDVKLVFFMGFLLGWPAILVALFISFTSGAIIGLALIGIGKKTIKSQVPFGPFLIFGTFVVLFWGNQLVNWYLDLFL